MPFFIKILYILFLGLQIVLISYFLQPFILLLIYLIKKKKDNHPLRPADKSYHFAAIITAHRDSRFIRPLVDSLLKQTYHNFMVYVVADECNIADLHFNDPRIILLRPDKGLNAKIKSISHAIENFKIPPDALIIFDSDNLVHPDYLSVVNQYYNNGFKVIQTNMQPKNKDNVYSRLDAAYDMYHNFTDREVRMLLGLSSNIWGLGIVIDTGLYKEITYEHALGGFDKKLQMDLVLKTKIAYAEEALVYDEKVTDGKVLERQRSRWIYAYFKHVKYAWKVFITGMKKKKVDLVFFGYNLMGPPLIVQMICCCLMLTIDWWINPAFSILWISAFSIYVIAFTGIIAIKDKSRQILYSLPYLPLFVFRLLKAFLRINAASKNFLKTEHNQIIYIDELLKNEIPEKNIF